MEIEKVIRILSLFITVAAFALCIARYLIFPEASLISNLPITICLVLAVCNIWSCSTKKTNEKNLNK